MSANESTVPGLDPQLFGQDGGVDDPVDHLRPLRISITYGRAQRFLREGFLENHHRIRAAFGFGQG